MSGGHHLKPIRIQTGIPPVDAILQALQFTPGILVSALLCLSVPVVKRREVHKVSAVISRRKTKSVDHVVIAGFANVIQAIIRYPRNHQQVAHINRIGVIQITVHLLRIVGMTDIELCRHPFPSWSRKHDMQMRCAHQTRYTVLARGYSKAFETPVCVCTQGAAEPVLVVVVCTVCVSLPPVQQDVGERCASGGEYLSSEEKGSTLYISDALQSTFLVGDICIPFRSFTAAI